LAEPSEFNNKIGAYLKNANCWPTQAVGGAARLAKASDLVIPVDPAFAGFLDSSRYLDNRLLANRATKELALRLGAKRFTLNSLARLRCAGEDSSKLATKCIRPITAALRE